MKEEKTTGSVKLTSHRGFEKNQELKAMKLKMFYKEQIDDISKKTLRFLFRFSQISGLQENSWLVFRVLCPTSLQIFTVTATLSLITILRIITLSEPKTRNQNPENRNVPGFISSFCSQFRFPPISCTFFCMWVSIHSLVPAPKYKQTIRYLCGLLAFMQMRSSNNTFMIGRARC